MNQEITLLYALLAMVVLCVIVGGRMLYCRINDMRTQRAHPQKASTSLGAVQVFRDVRAADNFRNLFEVPTLFYTLIGVALAINHTPEWLVWGAWGYVALRYAHSLIHCTYNKVFHRLFVFLASFTLLFVLWIAFVASKV